MSCTLEPVMQSWTFLRVSTIKLNTDCMCPGHLGSDARSLQENSQSECSYDCSDTINTVEECTCTVHILCGL